MGCNDVNLGIYVPTGLFESAMVTVPVGSSVPNLTMDLPISVNGDIPKPDVFKGDESLV